MAFMPVLYRLPVLYFHLGLKTKFPWLENENLCPIFSAEEEKDMAKVNLFNQVRDFVEKVNEAGGKPLYELTPEEARGVLRGVQEA